MARFEDFIREWNIKDWSVEGSGPIPRDGFARGSLAIVAPVAQLPGAPRVVNLSWKDERGRDCKLLELSFREDHGTLHDPKIPVSFGGLGRPVTAAVTLSITDAGVLLGEIQYSGPPLDGNTGTFAADAEPPVLRKRPGRGAGRDREGTAAVQYHGRPQPREK